MSLSLTLGFITFLSAVLGQNGGLLERGISYFRLWLDGLITVSMIDSLLVFGLFAAFVGCTKQN